MTRLHVYIVILISASIAGFGYLGNIGILVFFGFIGVVVGLSMLMLINRESFRDSAVDSLLDRIIDSILHGFNFFF